MNKMLIFLMLLSMMETGTAYGQSIILNSNQYAPLLANAGDDVAICSGKSVIIGDNPSASYVYEGYVYLWSPAVGLDDPAKANFIASPTVTPTYLSTVTDFRNHSFQDKITVTVKTSGIDLPAELIDFKAYPNPTAESLLMDVTGVSGDLILEVINSTEMILHKVNRDAGPFFRKELDTRLFCQGELLYSADFGH